MCTVHSLLIVPSLTGIGRAVKVSQSHSIPISVHRNVRGEPHNPRMDSFFKAAVCDLDKLLDDFELNTGEGNGPLHNVFHSAAVQFEIKS